MVPMLMSFSPWEHYPSLEEDRLIELAETLRHTRDRAVEVSFPEDGDGNWSIGCRIYERTIFALRRASQATPWLRVLQETQHLRLTFAIGSEPLKLYKGDPDDVPGRSLVRSFAELRQMRLAFQEREANAENLSLRIAVESDDSGRATQISLVEVDEFGETQRVYEIPRRATNVVPMVVPPIDLAPPTLKLVKKRKKEEGLEQAGDNRDTGTSK